MHSEAPIPLRGVRDPEGVPCSGGGLQVGVTVDFDSRENVFLFMYIHKIYLTKVTFILAKDSKLKITKSPF